MNTIAFITPLDQQNLSVSYKSSAMSETELITGLGSGDRKTIEVIYDMYSGSLYGIIFRIIKDEETAQDVLQDAFVKIWQSFYMYDAAKGRLFTWISNLARNLALDKLKSKSFRNNSRNENIGELEQTVDLQFNVFNNPETIGIKEMVGKLKPDYRNIIDLVYYNGYTHIEASEKLNIPLGTLKTRMRMAVNELRNNFK